MSRTFQTWIFHLGPNGLFARWKILLFVKCRKKLLSLIILVSIIDHCWICKGRNSQALLKTHLGIFQTQIRYFFATATIQLKNSSDNIYSIMFKFYWYGFCAL